MRRKCKERATVCTADRLSYLHIRKSYTYACYGITLQVLVWYWTWNQVGKVYCQPLPGTDTIRSCSGAACREPINWEVTQACSSLCYQFYVETSHLCFQLLFKVLHHKAGKSEGNETMLPTYNDWMHAKIIKMIHQKWMARFSFM